MSESLDCKVLDEFDPVEDLGYWDVEPKSIRLNCSEEDVSFPLMVYGVRRDEVTYRVVNSQIASVGAGGELTLGTVRGVTMIIVTRKDDPCEVRYVQVAVECPCDEPPPGCETAYQTGGEPLGDEEPILGAPAPEAAPQTGPPTPAAPGDECDGAAALTMIVSGFTGELASHNGAYALVRVGPRVWIDGSRTLQVRGSGGSWRVEIGIGTGRYAEDGSPNLTCSGGHPVGAGTLTTPSPRRTGYYTIS